MKMLKNNLMVIWQNNSKSYWITVVKHLSKSLLYLGSKKNTSPFLVLSDNLTLVIRTILTWHHFRNFRILGCFKVSKTF